MSRGCGIRLDQTAARLAPVLLWSLALGCSCGDGEERSISVHPSFVRVGIISEVGDSVRISGGLPGDSHLVRFSQGEVGVEASSETGLLAISIPCQRQLAERSEDLSERSRSQIYVHVASGEHAGVGELYSRRSCATVHAMKGVHSTYRVLSCDEELVELVEPDVPRLTGTAEVVTVGTVGITTAREVVEVWQDAIVVAAEGRLFVIRGEGIVERIDVASVPYQWEVDQGYLYYIDDQTGDIWRRKLSGDESSERVVRAGRYPTLESPTAGEIVSLTVACGYLAAFGAGRVYLFRDRGATRPALKGAVNRDPIRGSFDVPGETGDPTRVEEE